MPIETGPPPKPAGLERGGLTPPTASTRFTVAAEWLLVAALTAFLAVHTLPRAWRKLNTDFPNYYLTAHLVREGDSTRRIYDWIWLQRRKDHLAIDQSIVGMGESTPFSALAVWPLASLPPLTAKHWWLVLNLGMLAAALVLLRSIAQLPWRHMLLLAALCFPVHQNLLVGQYYILLLLVLSLACRLYVGRRRFSSGLMIGLGFGLKLFPVFYLLYFLRKKDWKAFAGGVTGSAAAAAVSLAVFGWALNRTYVVQVLPWALRGEGIDPYELQSSSLAALLHRLFIYEPQMNPHPAWQAPWLFAVLHPLLQLAVFAPALLLADPQSEQRREVRLEWAAILLASLAISTSPASYHFTLLILPVCFLWKELQAPEHKMNRAAASAVLVFLYLAVEFPRWRTNAGAGWLALLGVPRLYALLLLCLFAYILLWRSRSAGPPRLDVWRWSAVLACALALSITLGLRHQVGLYENYRWRLAAPREMYMAAHPAIDGDSVLFTAMIPGGYRTGEENQGVVQFRQGGEDELAVTAGGGARWIEESGRTSRTVSIDASEPAVDNAESPVASPDGKRLAFLREDHGQARIWVRNLKAAFGEDHAITPPRLNVLEMSFLPDDGIVFAATSGGGRSGIFIVDAAGNLSTLLAGGVRYPAVSPDGEWLAYSLLRRGNWRLYIRRMRTGEIRRIAGEDCNNIEPAWEPDSRTLIYASDCGRQLWLTALCKRRILP